MGDFIIRLCKEHNYKNAMITERALQSVIIVFLFCINGDKKYPDVLILKYTNLETIL